MKLKTLGTASTAVLCLLLGMSAPGYAGQDHQDDKHDQAKPNQNSHQQAPPPQRETHQPPREEESRPQPRDQHQQPDRTMQEQRPQGDHVPQRTPDRGQEREDQDRPQHPQQARRDDRSQRTPEFQHSQQSAWQQHRASNWQSDHRTWRQRGGYDGYLIPDDRFRGHFGRDHDFRIGVLPFMIVGGYPRFRYGGYWFSSIDPWPEYWGDDWYDTDDVYVDYLDNGYYLFNPRYPGPGIAISVSM
jgi:hypothetical protein